MTAEADRDLTAQEIHPINIHIGGRLKMRRNALALSQEVLGRHLERTFQQIQKYERGTNRMAPEVLYTAAQFLEVPVSYFFEDYETSHAQGQSDSKADHVTTLESAQLLKVYGRVANRADREVIQSIVLGLSTFKTWQQGAS